MKWLKSGFSSLVICLHFKGDLSKHNVSTPRVETQALQPPQRMTLGKSEVWGTPWISLQPPSSYLLSYIHSFNKDSLSTYFISGSRKARVLPTRKLIQTLTLAFFSSVFLFPTSKLWDSEGRRGKWTQRDKRCITCMVARTPQCPSMEMGESSGFSFHRGTTAAYG